ncbi:hypothetical protein [Cellulomonas soli]
MRVENLDAGAQIAARLLRCPVTEIRVTSKYLPEIDAFYYWQPIRGGGKLLVARDGSVLFGNSSITVADMIEPFRNGRRTGPALFDRRGD